jgi:hypothetical protein
VGTSDDFRYARDVIFENVLDKKQIAQAEQMARDGKSGDCPSAEHRLGVSKV